MLSVDTSSVFKRPLHCSMCDDDFYFTLRSIAEGQEFVCPHCGSGIDLNVAAYRPLVDEVRATIAEISEPHTGSGFDRLVSIPTRVMKEFGVRG